MFLIISREDEKKSARSFSVRRSSCGSSRPVMEHQIARKSESRERRQTTRTRPTQSVDLCTKRLTSMNFVALRSRSLLTAASVKLERVAQQRHLGKRARGSKHILARMTNMSAAAVWLKRTKIPVEPLVPKPWWTDFGRINVPHKLSEAEFFPRGVKFQRDVSETTLAMIWSLARLGPPLLFWAFYAFQRPTAQR